mmetsp:Transcript_16052/g.39102  ORF Transcript_16052/g.39102 Transcript_16052/m.39102 type:complete len:279 (-) Transcript_16052:1292-2128(-)
MITVPSSNVALVASAVSAGSSVCAEGVDSSGTFLSMSLRLASAQASRSMRRCVAGRRSTCVSSSVATAVSWYTAPEMAAAVPKNARSASRRGCVPCSRCRRVDTTRPPRLMMRMASAGRPSSATTAPGSSVSERSAAPWRLLSSVTPQSRSICSVRREKPGTLRSTCSASFSSSTSSSPSGMSSMITDAGSFSTLVHVRVTTPAVRRCRPARMAPSPKASRVESSATSRPSQITATLPSTMKYMSSSLSPCAKMTVLDATSRLSQRAATPRTTAGARR